MTIRKIPPYLKNIETTNATRLIQKIDTKTNKVISELYSDTQNGSYVYKKYKDSTTMLESKTVFDGKTRTQFVYKVGRNGKLKETLTRELMKFDTFIEWCDLLYNKSGKIVKEIIKVQGIKKTVVQTEIPPKKGIRK